ncbi:MAG TPA: transporter substrate-binding domain-containing protein [Candidatus Dorea gallistercoris]|uniref:Transporter substrate-binding domain-containing protein n=1 Tax=Candidatus Dorea gallistercoris TaxID=2838542 RepID=A0A9D1UEC3_9FIRM|nr:transporter substrate-binding domain-containing protein [Candidatus Dorea gallistercoris]
MKKKIYSIIIAMLCLAVLLLGGCGSSGAASSGTLTVGVRSDIVDFGYLNEKTGKYYGLEIDIANELAERLGYENVEFVTVDPDTRKDMLLEGEVDCLIACYSISESREENFDFSTPYYTDEAKLMIQKSTLFQDVEDLRNKTIGILSGSNAGPQLAESMYEMGIITDQVLSNTDEATEYEGLHVRKLGTYQELSEALEEGTVDAACMDGCITATYMDEDREIMDIQLAEQNYGVATQKGSELSGQVEEVIQEMLSDGTIDTLIDKWD